MNLSKLLNKRLRLILLGVASLAAIVYLYTRLNPAVSVVSSVPASNDIINFQSPIFEIRFNKDLSAGEIAKITATVDTEVETKLIWESPRILSVVLAPLKPDLKISLQILYNGRKIYQVDTTTTTSAQQNSQQEVLDQGKRDLEFGQIETALYAQKPFLTKLPINTSQFTIVYDFDKKSLRVRLKNTNPTTKQAALEQIKKIGAGKEAVYFLNN